MKPIPNHSRVLVKKIIVDQKQTATGILLPATADKEEKHQGKVMAVGKELKDKFEVGDVVFYGKYAGEDLKILEKNEEVEYKLLLDEDILGWIQ